MEALSSTGIPIYAEPGRNGGIFLLQDFILDRAILSEEEKREVLAAIQSISVIGYGNGKEMLTKLSALFNVNTRNWFEVDFSRWGKRVYDEFDETEITYQKNGALIVNAEMLVDTWLIGYLLSFGVQVEIIEPKYLKDVLAA